ncbi:MAG: HAMP domain-containing protein [Chloroflexi bacterium]|nr:MAG: HAMP domain-containing protein [Chloroflexota bacterium]
MNIRLRLTLWYTAIFSLILLIFSLAVYVGLSRNLFSTVDNHLQREVGEILGNLDIELDDDLEVSDREGRQTEFKLTYTPEEGVFWRIFDANGNTLVDPGYLDGAQFEADLSNHEFAQLENATLANGTPIRLYTAPFVIENHSAGVIQVAESYRHIQDVQTQLIFLLLFGIPLTLLASSAGGWFLASSALDPIDGITRAAHKISAHDLHQRLNLNLPNDEVGRLASTFDEMLERLETSFEQQRRFIADASHEMRTPLTILKGDVDVALARPRSAESYRQTLEMVNQTTDGLIALVQELLLLARSDSNHSALKLDRFNLSKLLTDLASGLMPKAVKKHMALNLDIPEIMVMEGDKVKLRRLFMNLIDNAIKYSNPGDSVTVRANVQDGQIRVDVSDTGPGIAPEHLPHLFDRFYRVDKARSRIEVSGQSSGAGLGLSIVQWLADIHHGQVTVESTVGRGTTFTVWLPQKQSQPLFDDLESNGVK